ncbi:zinc-ribbon domain-containing protein [Fructilactobacillus sanfranciscensis]
MKFCPHCGNKVADDASFCDKCGNKLTVVSRQAHKNFNPLFLMPKKHNNLKILLINS